MKAAGGALWRVRDFVRSDVASSVPRTERCELCHAAIARAHQHLIDPLRRELVCTCDGCAVLFDSRGATRLKRIPRAVLRLPAAGLSDRDWSALRIPIGLGFVYRRGRDAAVIAAYPSPVGVTESEIDEEGWSGLAEAVPALGRLQEDVEALLVNRLRSRQEYFVAPMDRCLELVGVVKTHWKGLSGGDEVWGEVERFMDRLREGAHEP